MTGHEVPTDMHEKEPRIVETFVVLDLDRTLFPTDDFVDLIYDELMKQGVPADKTGEDKSFVYSQTGTSFSLFDHMAQEFGEARMNAVMQSIEQLVKDGTVTAEMLLCKGTKELLEYLDQHQIPHAILTFGEQGLQDFKIKLTRLLLNKTGEELPATVTSLHKKAAWIADAWEQDDDSKGLHVPASITGGELIHAKNVVVIDDKVSNLVSDSEQVKGILVNNSSNRPVGSLSTEDLAEYLDVGLPLERISHFQSLNNPEQTS